MRKTLRLFAPMLCCIVAAAVAAGGQGKALVGVNIVNAQKLGRTVAEQNAMLDAMKDAGVRTIRLGINPTPEDIDFAERIAARGIRMELIVSIKFRSDAPIRPYQPKEFPGVWASPPLSAADPVAFRSYFQTLLDLLEKQNIRLAGFELGNEINSTSFNGEFPLPGKGTIFSLNDLYHDPEAKQIARGYLQYLKLLAVLKDIRDHSRLNQKTPILAAGFAGFEGPDGPKKGWKQDSVSANASIDFMRANGLDSLVDAYSVHVYPWANAPGNAQAANGRAQRLKTYVLDKCQAPGNPGGKPCWITEWGFRNSDNSCPVNETQQVTLVDEMREHFRPYVESGQLQGLFYYAWLDTFTDSGIYRCNRLMRTGQEALRPLP